jgi:Rrf2 family nitric oxide-sensitive transcriptional repressor
VLFRSVLIYLGLKGERLATIQEIAEAYGISRNHLMKIVHHLGRLGVIETVRGKGGGMRLAKRPRDISVGAIVREMEEDLALVQCFDPAQGVCQIDGACRLKGILHEALDSFLTVLDRYTLEDLLAERRPLIDRLGKELQAATHSASSPPL